MVKGKIVEPAKLKIVRESQMKLRALNHPLRQKILQLIGENPTTVTAIYSKLKIEQSVASQMLKILRDAEMVKSQREGKKIFYTVNQPEINRTLGICEKLTKKVA